jgi:hypothetical protein
LYDYHARYYDPTLGRFVSADSIVPGAGKPQALNRYAYTFNNPLKYTDPSGHCPRHDDECEELQWQTQQQYGIQMWGDWSKNQISVLQDALTSVIQKTGMEVFKQIWGGISVVRYHGYERSEGGATFADGGKEIRLWSGFFTQEYPTQVFNIVHEFGHAWDYKAHWQLSSFMKEEPHSWYESSLTCSGWLDCKYTDKYFPGPNAGTQESDLYSPANAKEDFAQAFAIAVMGERATSHRVYGRIYTPAQLDARIQLINQWLGVVGTPR